MITGRRRSRERALVFQLSRGGKHLDPGQKAFQKRLSSGWVSFTGASALCLNDQILDSQDAETDIDSAGSTAFARGRFAVECGICQQR